MEITKKLTGVLTGLMVAATIFGFVMLPSAQALTQAQIDNILGLLESFGADASTLADVESALNGEPTSGNGGGSSSSSCDTYGTSSLVYVGMTGSNVEAIQMAMNQILELSGNTSMDPLVVDGIFGPLTMGVVQYFQGIIGTVQDGVWGPNTQAAYLAYVADNCDGEETPEPGPSGEGAGEVEAVSMDGGDIATGGNANVFAFEITAGEDDLEIDDIAFKRYGNSVNGNWENFKVVDEDGVVVSNSVSALNSSNKAVVSFTPDLEIPSGESHMFYLRAGVDSSATNGQSAYFGIASMDDIDFVGSPDVDGSFPITGPSFEILGLTIGSLDLYRDGSTSDSTPDVGEENVVVNKFKLTAGSTEAITVSQIQVERQGSASLGDVANIDLYSVTDGETLATVDGWNAQGLATFNDLDMVLEEGDSHRFQIRLDILDGTGQTVNADLTDGSDVRIVAMGNDYGYYISPSVATGGWDGEGSSDQTIASGGFTVAKSSETPATGNIAEGDDQLLAVLDLIVTGEPVQISEFGVDINITGGPDYDDVTNVTLKNFETGETLAGPNDAVDGDTENGTAYEGEVVFNELMDLPVGTTMVGIYADLGTDFGSGDTIYAGVGDADADITLEGVSGDTVTASPASSNVNGNTLTIEAGSLTGTTLTTPGAQSVAAGSQDFVWAQFSFSAVGSGEDVEISDITIADSKAGDAEYEDLDNVELWADFSGSGDDSERGDRFETQISDTENLDSATLEFNSLEGEDGGALIVAKDETLRIAVVADLSSSAVADGGDTHTVDLSAATATGVDTGDDITVTPSGAGQAMTSASGGALTVSVDASSPDEQVVLDDAQNGMETLAIFRLDANNVEDIELDSMMITASGSGSNSIVDSYYFQAMDKDGNNLGSAIAVDNLSTTTSVDFPTGVVSVPKNDHIKVAVKATTRDVDVDSIANGDAIAIAIASNGDVDGTGLASGSAIASTGTGTASVANVFQSYPTFEWQTVSTTVLTGNGSHVVGQLKITANGDENITFQNADGNVIDFQAIVTRGDDDTAGFEVITVKDPVGVTLDTALNATNGTTELTLDFSSNDLTIPAGGSKTIKFQMNTADLESANDSVQLQLDSSTGADLDFGIDGANFTNAVADVLWRGDMMSDEYSQVHVKPSS